MSASTKRKAALPRLLKKFTAWALLDDGGKYPHAVYATALEAEMRAARCPGINIQKVRCVAVGKAKATPW